MRRKSLQIGILALALTLGWGLATRASAASAASTPKTTVYGATVELQVSPRLPTGVDPIRLSAAVTWAGCPIVFHSPVVADGRFVIDAEPINPIPCPVGPNPVTYRYDATLPLLSPGGYEAVVQFQGVDAAAVAFTVGDQGPDLFLGDGGRFDAQLRRADGGTVGSVPLTGQAGYYWFFDSSNVEATIKILDGRFVNGHFWVFVASMTDVPFTLTIIDLAAPACQQRNCPQKVYTSLAGKNTNFIDVTAF
jgi:hypothetical protein